MRHDAPAWSSTSAEERRARAFRDCLAASADGPALQFFSLCNSYCPLRTGPISTPLSLPLNDLKTDEGSMHLAKRAGDGHLVALKPQTRLFDAHMNDLSLCPRQLLAGRCAFVRRRRSSSSTPIRIIVWHMVRKIKVTTLPVDVAAAATAAVGTATSSVYTCRVRRYCKAALPYL